MILFSILSLILPLISAHAENCLEEGDTGFLFRGTVDTTRRGRKCIKWGAVRRNSPLI
jgi:hypothetical protein